jgi:exodeoxyribonuclease V beta subunit
VSTPPQADLAHIASFAITDELPTGTTLLEASAGTGKTWTIASLVARYVAEGICRLDQMLVVTFGRAASEELRERVREQLVAASRVLAHPDGADLDPATVSARIRPLLQLLLAGDTEAVADRRRRVRDALADFDAATIATTHQFCHMVLASLGVAGDTDAAAHLVEDLDDLIVEVVDDLYVRGFARDPSPPLFERSEALAIARAAANDPQAQLEPRGADRDTPEGRRRGFAHAFRQELDRRKRRLGVLSYDDLLSQLAEALAEPDAPARQRMRQRWQVVLVDEFQDTDPVQWQVLDRAFTGHATMILVGDPKQAIYAFRGGDVVAYLQAARTAGRRATLATNQRTDAPLLASLQALLRGAALGEDEIVVRDVAAAHDQPRLLGAPHPAPFRLRLVDRATFGAQGNTGVAIAQLREHVAADLARDIGALLAAGATFDGRPLQPPDIAVLCATRNQGTAVQHALTAHDIRSVVSGSGSVFRTEAARNWLTLLEAMEQPHRTPWVRAAALTPFLGRTAAELDAGGDALTDTDAETIRDWAQLLKQRGVAAVFEAASANGDLAARVLGRTDGQRQMTDLRHAGEALHQAGAGDGLGLVALISWLRQQIDGDPNTVAGERARRLDSDTSAVQILTIHGSKGLEFPVVYLPTLCDTYPRTPAIPLFHDEHGQRCIDVGGAGSNPTANTAAAQEASGEELRLLYVALTRAQSQVVTWWFPSARNTTTSPLHRMMYGRTPGASAVPRTSPLVPDANAIQHARMWEAAGGPAVEPSVLGQDRAPDAATEPASLAVRRFTRDIDHDWRRTSYTGLSSAAQGADPTSLAPTSEPEDPPRDDEPQLPTTGSTPEASTDAISSPMADLPVGATFGSLVHAVLEHADPAAPDRGGDWRAELAHHVASQLVRWPVDLEPDRLTDALIAVCDSPLGPLAGTTLRQIGRGDRMCELNFEMPLSGGDDRDTARVGGTLRDLAGLLRQHLPDDDPLRPFADVLDHPAYEQSMRGYLTGSLDVIIRVDGRYVVIDYKTNWLGPFDADLTCDAYRPGPLTQAMNHSSYPLQALLYAVVLHRFLRWRIPAYSFTDHFGGVMYLFVRGMAGPATPAVDGHPCGVFSWRPPGALVEAVSDLLDGADTDRQVLG